MHEPVGLAWSEASFATNFVDATPTEHVTPTSRPRGADRLGDPDRLAEQPRGAADVEERLVERDRLHERAW